MIGVDLAKSVFHLHATSMAGEPKFRRKLSRQSFSRFMAEQPPALVVMEACGSAHYWAREMIRLGHKVKLIAPQYVKPFVNLAAPPAARQPSSALIGRPTLQNIVGHILIRAMPPLNRSSCRLQVRPNGCPRVVCWVDLGQTTGPNICQSYICIGFGGDAARNRNGLYLIIGVLAVAAMVFGYQLYQQRQKTTSIEINVGKSGIAIEKRSPAFPGVRP